MAIPYLEIEAGAERKRFDIPEGDGPADFILGRAPDCQMVIPSAAVSRRHARVRRREREVTIEDLGSSNGTFVNSEKISAPTKLKNGDRISFGTVELIFVAPQPEPEADATIALGSGGAATMLAPPIRKPVEEGTVAIPVQEELRASAPAPAPVVEKAARAPEPPSPKPRSEFTLVRKAEPVATAKPVPKPAARGATTAPPPPGLLELAAIAIGSFVAVFAIGAVLVRYVF
jgi:hypothetical protein